MNESKIPRFLELFEQGRSAYDLVLGAMLGAYLGLTISRQGVAGGSYHDLGLLLLLCSLFVLCINSAGDRLHRRNFVGAGGYSVAAIVFGFFAYGISGKLGIDGEVLATIFVVWAIVIGFEMFSGLVGLTAAAWTAKNDK